MHMVRPSYERVYIYNEDGISILNINQNNNKIIVFIKLFPIYVCTYCVYFFHSVSDDISDRFNQKYACIVKNRDVEIDIIHAWFSVC